MSRHLTILEVSQKQAYIFSSNKLAECVKRSDQIAAITGPEYLERIAGKYFKEKDNLVYAGGGHTILEFPSATQAFDFCKCVTKHIHEALPELELFTATIKVDENKDHAQNQHDLIAALEKKKSLRSSSFHQGTFGVEKLDVNTKNPKYIYDGPEEEYANSSLDESLMPKGFEYVKAFGELGGSRDKSNYIAVVHIDGNGMGSRVDDFYKKKVKENVSWEEFRKQEREFSEAIDDQYKQAFGRMLSTVAKRISEGRLDELNIKGANNGSKIKMPVRRLITSGDDICFVAEGRIGIECAVEFIKALKGMVNPVDNEDYPACAGVAIVHQKYPFYRAYEIAEELCSNAKKYAASISKDDNGKCVCAIDWHLEKGELADSIDEVRANYIDRNGNSMIGRPFIIEAPEEIISKHQDKNYQAFRLAESMLQKRGKNVPRSKIKGLREVLKEGKEATDNYIKFYKMSNVVDMIEKKMEFDAIEIMDTFISLE